MIASLFLCCILAAVIRPFVCTHYRGSMISWRVVNETSATNVRIEILQRHAWRYDSATPFCTETTIANKQPKLGSGNIVCANSCPAGLSTLGSVSVPCTGYSISEQYVSGEGRFTFNVRKNASFTAVFTGKGWFLLVVSPDAHWSVAVQIQTFKRSNGRYNNAPIVTMLPIYRLRRLKTYVLKINVADNDFDYYRCLWSTGTTQRGNLTDNVPGATLDQDSCYLTFTPQISGYYAVALTIEDFETASSPLSDYLSQVPIQFVFRVYDSLNPCWSGPNFVGDLKTDTCIYLPAGTNFTTRIRLQVQCDNATLAEIISVRPIGLTVTNITQDPFDKTIFIYFIYYFADPAQYGQNLYCFSGVDSIGNQGPSSCLRFIVEAPTVLLNPLYTLNATRFPIGTVPSMTSVWTIITNITYLRPTIECYIRFKRTSDNADVYRLNVVTETTNVQYLSDRLVIISNVAWSPGEKYYIYFDSGVLSAAATCTKPSMPIIDPLFWPFNIPYETTSTTTTSTSTTSVTSTLRPRTTPTQRKLMTYSTTTQTTSTTRLLTTETPQVLTMEPNIEGTSQLKISEMIAVTLGTLVAFFVLCILLLHFLRTCLIHTLVIRYGLRQQLYHHHSGSFYEIEERSGVSHSKVQYRIKRKQRHSSITHQTLIDT